MTEYQIKLAQHAIRKFIDSKGYKGFISDDACRECGIAVLEAVLPRIVVNNDKEKK